MGKHRQNLRHHGLKWISYFDEPRLELRIEEVLSRGLGTDREKIENALQGLGYFKIMEPAVFSQRMNGKIDESLPDFVVDYTRFYFLSKIQRVYTVYEQNHINEGLLQESEETRKFLEHLVKGYRLKNAFQKEKALKELYKGLTEFIQEFFEQEKRNEKFKLAFDEVVASLLSISTKE